MNNLNVATTIINQMGGAGRLSAMVGASNFVGDTDSVMFSFKGCRKANKCRVTLLSSDTYKFELYKYSRKTFDCPVVYEADGIYWDMLKPVFERWTGLRLSL